MTSMTEQRYLLIKLAEESSEISQAVMESLNFGLSQFHDAESVQKTVLLHNEINDLLAALDELNMRFELDYKSNKETIRNEKRLLNGYAKNSQYLLLQLSSQACKLAQRTLKTIQFGLLEVYPLTNKTNQQVLHEEIDKLMAIVELLNTHHHFNFTPNAEAINDKKEKMKHYFFYILRECESV